MRIALVAGGTGGHVVPALAVAEALRSDRFRGSGDRAIEIEFVGTGREVERRLIANGGYPLHALPADPLLGSGIGGKCKLLVRAPRAFFRASALLRTQQPNVVVGFGGYPSVMPVLAAALQRIPIVLHESNVQVGLANRLLARFAKRVIGVSGARGFSRKTQLLELPNPVREKFFAVADLELPKPTEPLRLLVVGGSQGAVTLSDGILALVEEFRKFPVQLTHQTGAADHLRVERLYREKNYPSVQVVPFIDDMPAAYQSAHLVITRAGAMSVAEVSAAGRCAIFVPLAIAQGHQRANIERSLAACASVSVEHGPSFVSDLREAVLRFLRAPEELLSFAKNARALARVNGEPSSVTIARAIIETATR